MYFIRYIRHNAFFSTDGLVNLTDFERENHHVLGAQTLAKSNQTLQKLQSLFPQSERNQLQILTQAAFKKWVKKSGTPLNKTKILSEQSISAEKLVETTSSLIKEGVCQKINSNQFFQVIPKPKPTKKPPNQRSEVIQNSPSSLPMPSADIELIPQEDIGQPSTKTTITNNQNFNDDPFFNTVSSTFQTLSSLLQQAQDTVLQHKALITSVENQITDLLHFIEFEPADHANCTEVYQRLHTLRVERRQLKDHLYLSELLLATFHDHTPTQLQQQQTKVQKLFQRAYTLRAPEHHPHNSSCHSTEQPE